jgi:hypothetical protein
MTALPAVYTLILTRLCISMLDTRIPGWRLPCIGREIADPFYSQHPARFAPWQHARRVALFPHPFSALGWVDKKHIVNATSGQLSNNQSSVLTSIGLKHFVACECDNHRGIPGTRVAFHLTNTTVVITRRCARSG